MYGSNILDSSIKFGTKLRWERISKYYKRGYNIVAPLYLRVHGLGAFSKSLWITYTSIKYVHNNVLDAPENITPNVHTSTNQMIELMCLMKMSLMRLSHGIDHFGIDREGAFYDWPRKLYLIQLINSSLTVHQDDGPKAFIYKVALPPMIVPLITDNILVGTRDFYRCSRTLRNLSQNITKGSVRPLCTRVGTNIDCATC